MFYCQLRFPGKLHYFSTLSVSQACDPLRYRYFHAVLPVLAVIPADGQPGQYFRIRAGGCQFPVEPGEPAAFMSRERNELLSGKIIVFE